MRILTSIITLLVLTSFASVAVAEPAEEPSPTTETVTYAGVVGCSVAVGFLATADNCGDNTFAYGPSYDNLTSMEVTFSHESHHGETLQLRFHGPPTGSIGEGTHTFGNGSFSGTAFNATFDVRAGFGIALDTAFDITIVYTYAEAIEPIPEETTAQVEDENTFTFDGFLGCSAAVGPLAVADRCDDNDTFAFTAPENVTGLDVTLEWDSETAPELSFALTGPGGKESGTSPLTASYDNTTFEGFENGWNGTVHVRAAHGVALDVPFTVTLVFATD